MRTLTRALLHAVQIVLIQEKKQQHQLRLWSVKWVFFFFFFLLILCSKAKSQRGARGYEVKGREVLSSACIQSSIIPEHHHATGWEREKFCQRSSHCQDLWKKKKYINVWQKYDKCTHMLHYFSKRRASPWFHSWEKTALTFYWIELHVLWADKKVTRRWKAKTKVATFHLRH